MIRGIAAFSLEAAIGTRRFRPLWRSAISGIVVAGVSAGFCGCRPATQQAADRTAATTPADANPDSTHEPTELALFRADANRPSWFDPRNDGWDTEVFGEEAKHQLQVVTDWVTATFPQGQTAEPQHHAVSPDLGSLVQPDFTCSPIRPQRLRTVHNSPDFRVEESVDKLSLEDVSQPVPHGPAAAVTTDLGLRGVALFEAELRALFSPFPHGPTRAKFKVVHVARTEDGMETRQLLEVGGITAEGRAELNAVWRIQWRSHSDGSYRMQSLSTDSFQQTTFLQRQSPLFADVTESVFAGLPAYHDQLAFGIDHWRMRVERGLGIAYNGQHGLAIGDANGDGWDDLYVCQPGTLPNRLLIQQADGTVRDASAEAGVDILNDSRSALWVDFDNDDDQDLVISTQAGIVFLANDGAAHFQLQHRRPGTQAAYSLAAADYDLDGDLDVYLCYYHADTDDPTLFPAPLPYHDANNGGRNVMLRNDGNWDFVDVTNEIGMDVHNRRFSFAAAWEDYDNDGDVDLYVANDFGRNNLYRNDDGHFVDVAAEAGIEDGAFGMSVSWGDYNRDGNMDAYVGNMFSAAGHRVTYQRKFKANSDEDLRGQLRRLARGNSLFENAGDGTFHDTSVEAGVTMGRWSWASLFADINNDGWEDLLVANGYITAERPDDL